LHVISCGVHANKVETVLGYLCTTQALEQANPPEAELVMLIDFDTASL